MKTTIALLAAGLALTGCANQILSDDRIQSETQGVLGQSVRISDRSYDGMTNTYYTATTSRGSAYRCTISGSALSMGLTNPPSCTRL